MQDHLTRVVDGNGTVTKYEYGDRELLTKEISEVSGITRHRYDAHGNAVQKVDARDIYVERKYDALDRLTDVLYPDPSYNTKRVYDDPNVPFSNGRLTSIQRHGDSVDYAYDRFGRMLQDGDLGLGYDRNGNRTLLEYPGGVIATYTFDFADREKSLTVDWSEGPTAIVTDAEYLPSGPLTRLERSNGMTEFREYDNRYHPARIFADGVIDWVYETDAVGNPLTITDALDASGNRIYGYQDVQYYLTRGDGPWGELSWTYDRLGNRLTETRDGVTTEYSYRPNAAGNASPVLASTRDLETGEVVEYRHDAAGNLILERGPTNATLYNYDDSGRLSEIRHDPARGQQSVSNLAYDGRSLISANHFSTSTTQSQLVSHAAMKFSSSGFIQNLRIQRGPNPLRPRNQTIRTLDQDILYFSHTPLALWDYSSQRLKYLVSDHLRSPIAATTEEKGEVIWTGGFEPFGMDFREAPNTATQAASIQLRFPGQITTQNCEHTSFCSSQPLYNVYRWYYPTIGQYGRPDPLGLKRKEEHPYLYARSNPTRFTDFSGLTSWTCTVVEATLGVGLIGAAVLFAECDSGCQNGKRASGQYLITTFGPGSVGVNVPVEIGTWTLEDGGSSPAPRSLEGPFRIRGCSITPIIGFSISDVAQGQGKGEVGGAASVGLGAGCGGMAGRARLIDQQVGCCYTESL